MRDNFDLVEGMISSCPACRNNFRSFFCSFTCSPDQGTFVNVSSTQLTYDDRIAIKSLDFFVGEPYATGFYDSCQEVKMSAANDFAMTFIGGGAKDAPAFLKFLGTEKEIGPGSPFQIDFSFTAPPELELYDPPPRNCSDNDLQSRCTCVDCSDVCKELPPLPALDSISNCHIGQMSCFSFILTNIYAIIVAACVLSYAIKFAINRRVGRYERVALAGEDPSDNPLSPRSNSRSLLGATSLSRHVDGADSVGGLSGDSRNLGRGASLLDPMETLQPRQYRLNVFFRRSFYRLGLLCATYPWLTFACIFTIMGLLNIGWKHFEIETDPVRLWVAPNSESKLQKEYFDQHFGPFYRPQQIFITSTPPSDLGTGEHVHAGNKGTLASDELPPILTWETLQWWFSVESEIRSLQSPGGYGLQDVCFKPSGPGTPCVIQSITAWFDYDLYGHEDDWQQFIMECAGSPGECLPDFGQPLSPQSIMGGLPDGSKNSQPEDWLQARALVVTIVVNNSLDPQEQGKAMEWERSLRDYLERLSTSASQEHGLQIFFSTGVSLEEELNKSTNMDVKIVVLSYVVMFFYVALSLGSNASTPGEQWLFVSLLHKAANLPHYFRNKLSTASLSLESSDEPHILPRIPRRFLVNSKVTLGLFGVALVILSVSSSVGLFSLMGVKVTLIIAEVIPFLVLAVGVDNVFILVHELDRQNLLHGPNASAILQNAASATTAVFSPSHLRPSPFSSSHDDSVDAVSVPLHLSSEERVARALAKMGPSILLSSITETAAFALGALVPMPAVRNFALYASGSVFLNAILQVTVFVSALAVDLSRVEVSDTYESSNTLI